MIIWLDGAYGVGKTTVAVRIKERLTDYDVEILDSDLYWNEIAKTLLYTGGGVLPQNNDRLIFKFKEIIREKSKNPDKIIIAVMALTQKECKEKLWEDLICTEQNILHVILEARKETIISRINHDENGDKGFRLSYLNWNLSFLNNNYKSAIRIDTENKRVGSIVDEIIRIALNMEMKK